MDFISDGEQLEPAGEAPLPGPGWSGEYSGCGGVPSLTTPSSRR